jgi:alpha-galactosidase
MSEHLDPPETIGSVAETTGLVTETSGFVTETTGFVHLRSPVCSLLLEVPGEEAAGRSALPQVLHWGPTLHRDIDAAALVLATSAPIPHASPDDRMRRHLVPMPVDGWRLRPGLRGSRADGTAWSPLFTTRAVESGVNDERTGGWVVFDATDERTGLRLETRLTLHPSGVLEMEQSLRNDGREDFLVAELAATLPIPARALEVLDLTGRWCREHLPQRQHLNMGAWIREGRHGRTGHDSPLVLTAGPEGFSFGTGEVWGLHLAWSGDSSVWAERNPAGLAQVGAAELLAAGEVRLAHGQTYVAPRVYAAYSDCGLDGMSAAFHQFVRSRPHHPKTPRPVILNTWEAVYFDHGLERLSELADAAARIGVERFVLDDGWFGGRRDDTAGLGDWQVSNEVWPGGLGPLIAHVRSLGMDFGLWVEPEMVNPDSDLFRAHPDWILQEPGRLPPTWRSQHTVDLANPLAFAFLLERLDTLLSDHDIAYLKWDHNRDLVDAGHEGRPGVRLQTLALYRLLDELRSRHPHVEIESCASGGGRIDLGILQRTDRIWPSDTLDALERQHIQRWTQLLIPPELVGTHIGSTVSHTTGRHHSLSFRAATAIFGHLGIEWDLTSLSAQDAEDLAGIIAFHKRVRSLLHTGRVVRIDHPDSAVQVHGVVSKDRTQAVFACVQLTSSPTEVPAPARLSGLDDQRRYLVTPVELAGGPGSQEIAPAPWVSERLILTGEVLMRVGLQMPVLRPEQAMIVHLTAVGGL